MQIAFWHKLRDLIQTLFLRDKTSSLKHRLIRGAAGAFGLRISYTGLTFVASILLARLLGASDFGAYNYAVTWAYLLSIPATLGLDNFLVRQIAVYQTQSAWGLLRGLWQWTNQIVLLISVSLALTIVGLVWSLGGSSESRFLIAFSVAMGFIPIAALRNLRQGAMRGLHHISKGFVPEMLYAPSLLIIAIACAHFLLQDRLNAVWVVGMYVISAAISLAIAGQMTDRALPEVVKEATPEYQAGVWLRSALPFMFLVSTFFINDRIDILMLGAMKGAEEVGIYVPVNRGAQLIVSIIMAVRVAMEPTVASFYTQGKIKELQQVITKGARAILLVSLPVAGGFILFGHWYLLLFGAEFTRGKNALMIFCAGQLVTAAMGLPGALLNMTGHERHVAITSGASAVLNFMLNALFIPRWGVEGAAAATVISIASLNIVNAIWVRQKLGIHSSVLGQIIYRGSQIHGE